MSFARSLNLDIPVAVVHREIARAALGPQAVGREWTLGLSLPPARVRDLFQDVVAVTPRRAAR